MIISGKRSIRPLTTNGRYAMARLRYEQLQPASHQSCQKIQNSSMLNLALLPNPDPETSLLKKERISQSPTRLLAAIIRFQNTKQILGGWHNTEARHCKIWSYQVRLKQLTLCLTGRKEFRRHRQKSHS